MTDDTVVPSIEVITLSWDLDTGVIELDIGELDSIQAYTLLSMARSELQEWLPSVELVGSVHVSVELASETSEDEEDEEGEAEE